MKHIKCVDIKTTRGAANSIRDLNLNIKYQYEYFIRLRIFLYLSSILRNILLWIMSISLMWYWSNPRSHRDGILDQPWIFKNFFTGKLSQLGRSCSPCSTQQSGQARELLIKLLGNRKTSSCEYFCCFTDISPKIHWLERTVECWRLDTFYKPHVRERWPFTLRKTIPF